MTAEIKGVPQQTKEFKISNKPPAASGGAWDRFFLTALGRSHACQHLDLRLKPPEMLDKNSLFVTHLWYFIMAALPISMFH